MRWRPHRDSRVSEQPEQGRAPELEDPNVEIAVFGREVEQFIESDTIGLYLVRRAREQIEDAKEALLAVDPDDTEGIRRIQFAAATAQAVRGWLAEAITAGKNAERIIQQERDERA
jgi:hypothetical protein